MSARLIRVSTRRTGERRTVRVWIYDTLEELRDAAQRFNPNTEPGWFDDALGVCQTYDVADAEGVVRLDPTAPMIVRLFRGELGVGVVSHELNHAATHIYGATLTPDVRAVDVLHNANETLAHLQSDLTRRLISRLWDLGYYS